MAPAGRIAGIDESSRYPPFRRGRRRAPSHSSHSTGERSLISRAPSRYAGRTLAHKQERSKQIWEELELPPLKPRMPWYGYSLGAWTDEDEKEAERAVKGDYFATGEKQIQQRQASVSSFGFQVSG